MKDLGLFLLGAILAIGLAMPQIQANDSAKSKPSELSEITLKNPRTGDTITIAATDQGPGIWLDNKRTGRGVCLIAIGDRASSDQTAIGIYSKSQMNYGMGYNFAVSLDPDGKPIQQVVFEKDFRSKKLLLK